MLFTSFRGAWTPAARSTIAVFTGTGNAAATAITARVLLSAGASWGATVTSTLQIVSH